MSEIVYTHTTKNRDHIATMEYGRTTADRKVTIFASPNKVAYVSSVLVVGIPGKYKDKRYYGWRTVGSEGFYRNRAGNIQPYSAHRPWDFKRETPWSHRSAADLFRTLDTHEEFRHAVWDTFGFTKLEQLYPMVGEYGLPSYEFMPYSLRPAMRESDWESFTTKAFGKTRTTPRLVAAVQDTEPYIVALGQQFRGLVDTEDMVSFIENNEFDDEMMESFQVHNPNVRPLLKKLEPEARTAIIRCGIDLSDTRRIMNLCMMGKHGMQRYGDNAKATSWTEILGR